MSTTYALLSIFLGPSPIKQLKSALEAGDEAKAIEIYTLIPMDPKTNQPGLLAKLSSR
jgi:hypothetical protein